MTFATRLLRNPVTPLVVIALAAATWVVGTDEAEPAGATAAPPVLVQALETSFSSTAADWAREADFVVTGKVVDERTLASPVSETEVGTGVDIIGRSVTVQVTDVLWRSSAATVARPTTISMDAFGWMRGDDGTMREMATDKSPRLEVGHEYVMALVWQPERCADGDREPSSWTWIGSDGLIPADDGVLGSGESAGSPQTVAEARAETEPGSVEAANLGNGPAAVVDDLRKAEETVEHTPAPAATGCAR